jgi:hypothetical protein
MAVCERKGKQEKKGSQEDPLSILLGFGKLLYTNVDLHGCWDKDPFFQRHSLTAIPIMAMKKNEDHEDAMSVAYCCSFSLPNNRRMSYQ